jgi:hypothetical protein
VQTRRMSVVETCTSTALGFALSYALNVVLHAALALPMSAGQNLLMTGAFTVLSLVRSYFLRRLFNRWKS